MINRSSLLTLLRLLGVLWLFFLGFVGVPLQDTMVSEPISYFVLLSRDVLEAHGLEIRSKLFDLV